MILHFLEYSVFLGKSNSSMVSFTFTMSAMTWQPASVISQSPKINFLISCYIKFGVLRFVSGVRDHFQLVVGVLFCCGISCWISCGTSCPGKDCRCFVDLRSQRTGLRYHVRV